MTALQQIIEYCEKHNFPLFREPQHHNIIYLEGCGTNLRLNNDADNAWNDVRMVLTCINGEMVITHITAATTEPGRAATVSNAAIKLGGVFRIAFGYHKECWVMGHHKGNPKHPALVHAKGAEIWGYRDANRDGIRPGDALSQGHGINQHSTSVNYGGIKVDTYSQGCLVGRWFNDHLKYIALLKTDARYVQNNSFRYSASVLDASKVFS